MSLLSKEETLEEVDMMVLRVEAHPTITPIKVFH